jgi:signal transduction histidine kinase
MMDRKINAQDHASAVGSESSSAARENAPRNFARRFSAYAFRQTARLLRIGVDHPEMEKWVIFSRNILAVTFGAVLFVGGILTALSYFQGERNLEQSLMGKADSISRAVSRTVFVPLVLEDAASLDRVASAHAADPDIAYIRIYDAAGRLVAEQVTPGSIGSDDILERESPVMALAEDLPSGAESFGTVRIGVSRRRLEREARFFALASIAASTGVVAFVAALAVWLIRNMTRRMIELVDEVRLAEELRRSNQDLQQFAYVASHDLQEPLRTIASFLNLLEQRYKGKLDPTADEFIRFTVNAANRMRDMIQGLLRFARVKTQAQLHARVSLEQALAVVMGSLKTAIEETNARVTHDALPIVWGDEPQIVQLLQNLVGNALKYRSSEPPRIHVSAAKANGDWLVSVRDNGIGIEEKYLDRIFNIFQRLHTQKEYAGTGIGLALCKRIVETHGGRIWAESEPGKGSVFKFTLPATAEKAAKRALAA